MINPEPAEVHPTLTLYPMPTHTRSHSWADMCKANERNVGEVRSQADWAGVPINQGAIRIVSVLERTAEKPNGEVIIRWATNAALNKSHPSTEELLGYRGDDLSEVRSGYAYPQENGTFLVK
jgi:hypothetical protein